MTKHTEVMKLALEALETTTDVFLDTEGSYGHLESDAMDANYGAITALREALTSVPDGASEAKEQPAPATELREQEPVGEITAEDMGRPFNAIRIGTHFYKEVPPVGTKLYTSPQAQRTWVGLTQDEFRDFASTLEYGTGGLIRAIEAKLKEKNT